MYLCVLRWDLQQQGQRVVVEGLVQGEQRPVDAALVQVAAVLFEADALDPADHALVTPHQNIWKVGDGSLQQHCNDAVVEKHNPSVTFQLQLRVFSSPLQLLLVIVEPPQTHDTTLETVPVETRSGFGVNMLL